MLPQTADADVEFPLRHYLHIARRRGWTIALSTLLVGGIALGLALLQTPIYKGEAKLVLEPDTSESLFNSSTGQRNDPVRAVATEIEIIKGRTVQAAVRKKLGGNPTVSASPVGQTDVISVRGTDADPKRAAEIANAYATAYVDFKRAKAVESLLAAAREIGAQLTNIQSQADKLDMQIAASPGSSSDLRTQRDALIQQAGAFRQQLDQLQVQARLKGGGAQVVTPAEVPTAPSAPRPKRSFALGLILGFVIGVGLAFVREQLDESLRSQDDVELTAGDLPVLAIVPRVGDWRETDQPMLISLTDPNAQASEAYRSLRTAVQFTGLDHAIGVLQMTSPSSSEGKTTTLANLAVALAGAGLEVVVVCCDLRRPRVHEFFGLRNTVGFTSVLLGEVPVREALQQVPGVPRLRLLASGPTPPNPSELLSHERTGELLHSLRAQCHIVLIDSPPALPVTDAAVLSRWADATVIVVSSNQTSRKALERTLELLRQVSAPLIGIVLNGVSRGAGGYGYGYGYGYGSSYEASTNDRGRHSLRGRRSALGFSRKDAPFSDRMSGAKSSSE